MIVSETHKRNDSSQLLKQKPLVINSISDDEPESEEKYVL